MDFPNFKDWSDADMRTRVGDLQKEVGPLVASGDATADKRIKEVTLELQLIADELEARQGRGRQPVSYGGFTAGDGSVGSDTWSEDERMHRIGQQLQAMIASQYPDPSRKIGGFRSGVYRDDIINRDVRTPTGLGESPPSLGGFLVGDTMAGEVQRRVQQTAILWPLCRRFSLEPNTNAIKINYFDETARTAGNRLGGIRGYWLAEAATKTASKPKFGQVEMTLQKVAGLCYLTDELLDDASVLAEIVTQGFADELAFKKDEAVLRGDGAGKPLGILNADCLIAVSAASSANTILADDITGMWSRLHPSGRKNAVWVIHSDTLPQLMELNSAGGSGTGSTLWMPGNQLYGSPYQSLMGKRLIESEHCSSLSTKGDIFLADFSQYVVIEKPLQVASSIHVEFTTDQTVLRFVSRLNGQPWESSALTPAHGSNSTSSFVCLDTRT